MGFWSKLGKVAKIAAPFALDFIPGGQLAHLAMAAGLGAATSKGGVKSRLLGAGIGAGSQYAGNLLGGGKVNPLASGKRGVEGASSSLLGGAPSAAAFSDAAPDISKTAFAGGEAGAGFSPQGFSDALKPIENTGAMKGSMFGVGGNAPGIDYSKVGDAKTGKVGSYSGVDTTPPATEPGLASKLLHDPKTYYAALALMQGNPNGQDARRAYKGVDADANVRSLLDASNSNYDRAVDQQKNRTNYHADYWNPQPVIAGSSQIGGGMDTTEAERLMAEHEKGRA